MFDYVFFQIVACSEDLTTIFLMSKRGKMLKLSHCVTVLRPERFRNLQMYRSTK